MTTIVPAISSSVRGPLGVAHLPRLWCKALLAAAGRLPEGYLSGNTGFDKRLCAMLGIDPDALFAHLATLPTYEETEAWVRANATELDDAAIAAFNARIDGAEIVAQNDLEDWAAVHAAVQRTAGTRIPAIVPLVSPTTAGPLGIKHLPRLWLKAVIHGAGALPSGWSSGPTRIVFANGVPRFERVEGGLDPLTYEHIGLSMHDTCSYLLVSTPSYPDFERYVEARARKLDPASIAAHNAATLAFDDENDALDRSEFHRRLTEEMPS